MKRFYVFVDRVGVAEIQLCGDRECLVLFGTLTFDPILEWDVVGQKVQYYAFTRFHFVRIAGGIVYTINRGKVEYGLFLKHADLVKFERHDGVGGFLALHERFLVHLVVLVTDPENTRILENQEIAKNPGVLVVSVLLPLFVVVVHLVTGNERTEETAQGDSLGKTLFFVDSVGQDRIAR